MLKHFGRSATSAGGSGWRANQLSERVRSSVHHAQQAQRTGCQKFGSQAPGYPTVTQSIYGDGILIR